MDHLLRTPILSKLEIEYGHALVVESVRSVLDEIRAHARFERVFPSDEAICKLAEQKLKNQTQPTLMSAINATGVILHTNLGRAPLSTAATNAMSEVSSGYSTLEFDLDKGLRGSRSMHASELLKKITGAEDAFVVNNNAAAVLLCLSALAKHRGVVISRSQLIEIGGGFRIPEVMKQSGAKLVEVGTTNRVNLADYEEALTNGTAMVMRAHSSNFKIVGFAEEPDLLEIIGLTHQHGSLFIDDLGSGALLDTSKFGLAREPMVQESIRLGADLVCFSGDKLLGGPQAGVIVGKATLIDKLKKHPLARAVRADKTCLAGLSATLIHYLKGEAEQKVPVWRMIAMPLEEIHIKAQRWQSVLGIGEVIESRSTIGGGSLPEETLPTYVLALHVSQPNNFLRILRKINPPIIARVQNDKILFDPRTISDMEDSMFLSRLKSVL